MTPRWAPLHNHTYYSLLDGISKPEHIVKRCVALGYNSVAMTDHGNIAAAVKFSKAVSKAGLKPILGCEFYICRDDPSIRNTDNRKCSHLVVLAKNLAGWKQLIAASSYSNLKDHFYYRPRLSLESFRNFATGNFIAFSGHPGSDLANCIFTDASLAYRQTDYDAAKALVHPDWERRVREMIEQHISIFGKENFFLEIQILDPEGQPACLIIARVLRWMASKYSLRCVATADSHYSEKSQARDQRVVLCSTLKTTLRGMNQKLQNNEDVLLGGFFKNSNFHIPSVEELQVHHTAEEIEMSLRIAEMCEAYDITHPPYMPVFPLPPGESQDDYLRQLCRRGWEQKQHKFSQFHSIAEYEARLEDELAVFSKAGLAGYFLIVQDYMNWARSVGIPVGPARGSSGGSLVAYLTGIIGIDPIEHGLLRERFYNDGRNQPGRVALPDVDSDFSVTRRQEVINYIKNKFGPDHVAQIATYNAMKGRGALTDVFRAHEVDHAESKRICKFIPEESRITEELQEMKEAGEEPSIIQYALEHNAKELKEWVTLEDNGELSGPYAPYFAQAIRLEGTKRNVSRHASGLILSSVPLGELCPLLWDEGINGYKAGMEYPDLEEMGQAKFDILGTAVLDKRVGVQNLLLTGEVEDEEIPLPFDTSITYGDSSDIPS